MTVEIMKEYLFGDMRVRYLQDVESMRAGWMLVPADMPALESFPGNGELESLVQIKLAGDIYGDAFAMGISMRNSETVRRFRYERQEYTRTQDVHMVDTFLRDDRNYQVTHHLRWKEGTPYLRISCSFENQSQEPCMLEMMESFSLGNLSPYLEGDGEECLNLHRIRSAWSAEGRHEVIPVEALQLEPAWKPRAVRCERFGQAGSMPVNKFFPFAAVEDSRNHVFWGVQIAHPASWQIEVYRRDEGLGLSGGLADREFGHWMKQIEAGECFRTPEAVVTTVHSESFDIMTGRLTQSALEGLASAPDTEQELPIIFNEYCTTWGIPSHENITKILECIRERGFQYFVIDCGWYAEQGVPWDVSMGDYEVSKELFPEGLGKTVEKIKEAGMIPGIWFEIETVGSASRAYHMEDHLLKKDGTSLTSYLRRFWDMKEPWVETYLTEKVIGTLKKYGFGYMKIDYNETIGIGCDGAESLGEGLRQNMEASVRFIEKVKREVPGIVLENCASGGHRLEPGWMARMSMASFSDAHECVEIPIIAANLHRVIHPRQSQIWAVLRGDDPVKRIVYSIAGTFLGRMCISGDVTELSDSQWETVEEGMGFYRKIVPVIKEGQSYLYGTPLKSERHPKGWQALVRVGKHNQAYAVIHTFDMDSTDSIKVKLPKGCPQEITDVYSDTGDEIVIRDGELIYGSNECFKAIAVILSQADICVE